ncbi:1-deoxy-D-xylulose-5-phosphate reductoisomerase [Verrucomicrobiota bacterium]
MKKIVILGSTGSIGENALRVVEALPARFQVVGIAVQNNYKRALEQAEQFGIKHIAVADEGQARLCESEASAGIKIHAGCVGVEEIAVLKEADIVLCALVGMAGLRPVMAAIKNGTDVALATKEVLVAAGHIVTAACVDHGARLLPVDSEHSAVFQCLNGTGNAERGTRNVKRIILTASGGPFVDKSEVNFDKVSIEEVLDHPTWDMGRKVTVDSATLMNKGLEIIEAHWLFGVPVEKIDVVIHPESIVHSMVEFEDGSVVAQMSLPDMRFAIQYALTYPDRIDGGLPTLDLAETGSLNFKKPDVKRFPCLGLARKAADRAGTMPAVLNAANEAAVQMFLDGEIAFSGIWQVVKNVMKKHKTVNEPGLEEIMEADTWARSEAERRDAVTR